MMIKNELYHFIRIKKLDNFGNKIGEILIISFTISLKFFILFNEEVKMISYFFIRLST